MLEGGNSTKSLDSAIDIFYHCRNLDCAEKSWWDGVSWGAVIRGRVARVVLVFTNVFLARTRAIGDVVFLI